MARKNPLSDRDKAICARLREFRLSTNLSQVAFAKALAVDSSLLASYEHARVPIRYEFARHVNYVFRISLRWLAEGLEPKLLDIDLPLELESCIPEKLSFAEAYDLYLKTEIDRRWEEVKPREDENLASSVAVQQIKVAGVSLKDLLYYINQRVMRVAQVTPPKHYRDLYREIDMICGLFEDMYGKEIDQYLAHLAEVKNTKTNAKAASIRRLSKALKKNFPVAQSHEKKQ